MAVDAALFTIEHTGTRFFKKLLVPHCNLIQFHCRPKHIKEIHRAVDKGHMIFTTYRNPLELQNSWNRRGKDLERLAEQMMFWRKHVLPVATVLSFEHSLRDQTGDRLNEAFGLEPLAIDWTPEGAHEVSRG